MSAITDSNIEQLRQNLLAQRANFRNAIRDHLHRSEDSKQLTLANESSVGDDWAVSDLLTDTDIAQLNHELSELQNIDTALKRIDSGTYGHCTECGEPIAAERLQAVPMAKHCLSCQTKLEKHQPLNHTL